MTAEGRPQRPQSRVYSMEAMREHGVLWAINRLVFHPRGFALSLVYPDDATREQILAHEVEPIGWQVLDDGHEVWAFAQDLDESGFLEFEELLRGLRS